MSVVYLIPSFLSENAVETIPAYVIESVKKCSVIFAEQERTARRFLTAMDKAIVIDDYEWHAIHKMEQEQIVVFRKSIREGKNIAIISEAGCPGVADPGQILVHVAQKEGVEVKPLVGPSSILLALMASGLSGQQFCFQGYLPIDNLDRIKKIKEMEDVATKNATTQIFIETPFRNNKMLDALLNTCSGDTLLCLGVNITAKDEKIQTKPISEWKKSVPDLHKIPVIFLLGKSI